MSWKNPAARSIWLVGSFLLIGIIGVIDYLTGYELAFSPFYLAPVILATWLSGKRQGIIASLISAVVWWAADYLTSHSYSSPAYYVLNTGIRLANFLVVAALVSRLKQEMDHENQLARVDMITGIANARSFLEFLDLEVTRATRYGHAITVVYIDLDNFKEINDRFGHSAGDQALRDIAIGLHDMLRKVDLVARLGGDEFAIVLPETGASMAPVVCSRILSSVEEEMIRKRWMVTLSMGVVTAEHGEDISAERLLQQADRLMYEVKKNGKNNLRCAVYTL